MPSVVLERAHAGARHLLVTVVEVLIGIHQRFVFAAEALDHQRRRAIHPHVRSERQPVPRVAVTNSDAERGQRDQVGHDRRIGVFVDRHLRVR
jgi:hypothetical protein